MSSKISIDLGDSSIVQISLANCKFDDHRFGVEHHTVGVVCNVLVLIFWFLHFISRKKIISPFGEFVFEGLGRGVIFGK